MVIKRVKGTYDVLPSETYKWQALEKKIREILSLYNIREMRTPIMEYSAVFHRDSELSDMVTKETYNFDDRGNRKLTLRPEGTAGIIRGYVENKMYRTQEVEKVYYIGPNFRYERPQKGRYRQFNSFGIEAIGATNPALDAEMIVISYDFIKRLGLKGVRVKINSLGDYESSQNYKNALISHFSPQINELCVDCQKRLIKNPLRILDCKLDQNHEVVKQAPTTQDFLTSEAKVYFKDVLMHLNETNICYEIAPRLVRGLDYYSHTVFEIQADIEGFGAQNTLCGGGRYQQLISELGGPDLGAVGVGFGMERLLLALDAEDVEFAKERQLDAFIIATNTEYKTKVSKILYELRQANIVVDTNYTFKSFKAQLKQALRLNARYLIILGEKEYKEGLVGIKDTKTEIQENVLFSKIQKYLLEKLEN